MLPKKFRLPAKEFDSVYQRGKKVRGKYGMLVYSKNDNEFPRIGFVVSKKIGNAVVRHRMTRLLRVVFMELVNEMNMGSLGLDIQYIAFQFCDKKNLLKKEVQFQIKGVLND